MFQLRVNLVSRSCTQNRIHLNVAAHVGFSKQHVRIFIDSANSCEYMSKRGRRMESRSRSKNFFVTLARIQDSFSDFRHSRGILSATCKRIVTLFIFGTGLPFAPVCTGTLNSHPQRIQTRFSRSLRVFTSFPHAYKKMEYQKYSQLFRIHCSQMQT